MPTATFFRLPEEKRQRLMEACWAELTRVRFTDVSINRIILAAHIPRGSFYQYFEDKEDLIRFFLGAIRDYFINSLRSVLTEGKGDLFALPQGAFDRFLCREGEPDATLTRLVQILRMNPGFDPHNFLSDCPGGLPDPLWEAVDTRFLREPDREFAEHVFFLCISILAHAVMVTLLDPDQRNLQRKILWKRIEIIRSGCAAEMRQCMEVTI